MSSAVPVPVNLAELLAPHKGQWVALSHDEKTVLGHGPSIDDAINQAKAKGEHRPILIKAPDKNSAFLL